MTSVPRLLAALGLAVATALVATTPAQAHTSSDLGAIAFSTDGCEWTRGGYTVLQSQAVRTSSGTTEGRVYLLWNSTVGENCVVTLKGPGLHGSPHYTQAILDIKGETDLRIEAGYYSHFAAVAYEARGKCVSYTGTIQHPTRGLAGGGNPHYGFCGG